MFFLITILIHNISILKAQSPITWQTTLTYRGFSNLFKAHQASDGGYIAVGTSIISGYNKLFLVKLNIYGDTLWNKYYDLSINSAYSGFWIEETFDKGFIISGFGEGINRDAYLIKTDSSGNIQWVKTFGGSGMDQGRCVRQLSDNGYILLVRTSSNNPTDDILLIRTDSAGNEIWRKIYGNSTYEELGMEVQVCGNSGYIIAGWKRLGTQPAKMYLVRSDINGDSLWTKTFYDYSTSGAYSIDLTDDNGFIIGGVADSTNNNYPLAYVVKTDSIGNIEWQKRYASAYKEYCYSIISLPNNRYAFCGMGDSVFFEYERATIREIDGNGNTLWEKYFRGLYGQNAFMSVDKTVDNGFILSGYTSSSFGFPFIVRTDSLGNVNTVGINNDNEFVNNFSLSQNYPNPFNPRTKIRYSISKPAQIKIVLYEITGKLVSVLVDDYHSIGNYLVTFDADKYNLSSGDYFYSLVFISDDNLNSQKTLKMVYLK